MKNENLNTAKTYFESLFEKYGIDEKSLGWSKNKQEVRFEQLFKYIKQTNVSVLDVGCGFGDLYSYLENCGNYDRLDYCGIDIVDSFIEVANKKHAHKENVQFQCTSLMTMNQEQSWDWVVECGLFGLMIYDTEEQMYQYLEESMKKAFALSKQGISFNFLSDKVDYRTSGTDFHVSPERVLQMAYGLSRRVILDNSVMPFEFNLTVWKNDTFSTGTTLFYDYLKEKQ